MTDLIEEYTRWMEAGSYSTRYVQDRRYILRCADRALRMATGRGLEKATEADLATRLARRRICAGTRRVEHLAFTQFLCWAYEAGRVEHNAAARLRKPRVRRSIIRPPTDAQVALILAEASQPWRTFATLAACNGLRCCSIAALDRDDITEDDLYVRSKGGGTVVLDTDPATWRAVRNLPSGPVAVTAGGRADPRWISREGRHHFHRKLGVPVSMHGLRRWYATALDAQGEDILTIRDALGHAQVSTTQLYIVRSRTGRRRLAIQTPPLPTATP